MVSIRLVGLASAVALVALATGAGVPDSAAVASGSSSGIHKIKHVVVCVPDPATGACVVPYADHADVNGGGPHNYDNATSDINGGKMDGFTASPSTPGRT